MYKKLLIAASIVAMFASCAKNEVNPVTAADQEISYQTVIAPKTKADEEIKKGEFSTDNIFKSYAYFLAKDTSWGDDNAKPELYIDNETISKKENIWKGEHSYYWPKQGSLTFFSWSLNSSDLTLKGDDAEVTCAPGTGISLANYSAAENKNVDFMVAEIAKNRTANEQTYYTEGVPTLFQHKLCQVIFSVKTAAKYHTSEEYTAVGDKKFVLKKVTFKSIAQKGDYTQIKNEKEEWTVANEKTDCTYEINDGTFDNTEAGTVVTDETDQYYFIPQTLKDAMVEIVYEITTTVGENTTSTEKVTLETSLTGEGLFTDGWAMNTKYVLNITVGLDEILWDPAVEEWTQGTEGSWSIDVPQNN